jgi:hypothetical protein
MEVGGGAREVRGATKILIPICPHLGVGLREACNLFPLALTGTPTCPGGNASARELFTISPAAHFGTKP